MAKDKKTLHESPNVDDFFNQFQLPGENDDEPSGDKGDGDKPGSKDAPTDLAALTSRIDTLTKQVDDQNLTLSMRPAAVAAPVAAVAPAVPAVVNMEGLPDPIDDREGFAVQLNDRIQATLATNLGQLEQRLATKASQETQSDQLWTDFAKTYPDYTGREGQVDYMSTKVVTEAIARGIDAHSYVFGNRARFFADVKTRLDEEFAPPVDPAAAKGDKEGDKGDKGAQDDNEGRTMGMFGGNESGGKPATPEPGSDEDPGDLIAELRDMQADTLAATRG